MSCLDRVRGGRPGITVVEGVVTLLVSAILVTAVASTIIMASELERDAADRAERLAAGWHAAAVLSHELRVVDPVADGLGFYRDSVSLRAYRGIGVVCAADSVEADLRYRGIREPDPAKDSLLALEGAGPERALSIASVTISTGCTAQPGETGVSVRPGTGLFAGDVVLVYERGTYHLAGGALRYRRGAGGRQPLTPDVFLDDSTDLHLVSALAAGMTQPEPVAVRFRATVSTRSPAPPGPPSIRYLPFLNLPEPLDSLANP